MKIQATNLLAGLMVALGASAQQNYGLQALYQALHEQDFDGGAYDGTFTPTPQQMLQRVDGNTIQTLAQSSNALRQNPNDPDALVQRGSAALGAAGESMYRIFWLHFAAKDLENAIRLAPNNFYARHNYAQTCFETGDINDTQPIMHLAVYHFTKAIALKPDSARSYMGRGWAYLMLDDSAHAQADLQKALQLDPSLQPQLVKEANSIRYRRFQRRCAQAKVVCPPPPDATDDKYSSRAGGYVVR